jgi:hypothetical protein
VSSIKVEDNHLLVLDYIHTKLKQAQNDVELFSTFINELEELKSNGKKLKTNNNFLKIISNNKGES